MKLYYLAFVAIFGLALSCKNSSQSTTEYTPPVPSDKNGKELSEIYCASCHAYPDPSLLDKKTWMDKLLPNMGARLGIKTPNYDPYKGYSQIEQMLIEGLETYPTQPRIHQSDWDKIIAYYKTTAPEKLDLSRPDTEFGELTFFKPKKVNTNSYAPVVTLAKFDTTNHEIYIGLLNGKLMRYDLDLKIKQHYQVYAAPVDVSVFKDSTFEILGAGELNPNEQSTGIISSFNKKKNLQVGREIMRELKRPVQFNRIDLNNDGQDEIFVAEYGYESGMLTWYEKKKNSWKRRLLSNQSGASKILFHDFNKDGQKDVAVLFAQGDEHISIYYNKGLGEFEERVILRFPPVYGSADMQLTDFNKDGHIDILYTNGDNADYSAILKPYHGVRLFLNDGKDNFNQKWFYPLFGAFQAKAADFDKDGDYDIATSSFFPADEKIPSSNFLYLEQKSPLQFEPKTFKQANLGKWMTMDIGDIDQDGDTDILLGSFMLSMRMGDMPVMPNDKTTPFLLLLNNN